MKIVRKTSSRNNRPYARQGQTDNDLLSARIKTEPLSSDEVIHFAENRPESSAESSDSDDSDTFDPEAFDRGDCEMCPPNDTLPPRCVRGLKRVQETCRHCGLRLKSHSARILHELTHGFKCECGTRYLSYEAYHKHNMTCNYRSKFFCCYQNEGCKREFDCIRQMYHHEARCIKMLDSPSDEE